MSYLNPFFGDNRIPLYLIKPWKYLFTSYHASKRAPHPINVCYRCLTYSVFLLAAAEKTKKQCISTEMGIHHHPGRLPSKYNFTVGKLTQRVISFNYPSFPVDRLNGLPAGSTIVVENTTNKQHLNRTTTNKGKKLKSGNIIVWEANLRQ